MNGSEIGHKVKSIKSFASERSLAHPLRKTGIEF